MKEIGAIYRLIIVLVTIFISGCSNKSKALKVVESFYDEVDSIKCLPEDETLTDEIILNKYNNVIKQYTTEKEEYDDFGAFLFACSSFENMEYTVVFESEECAIVEYSGDTFIDPGHKDLWEGAFKVINVMNEWRIVMDEFTCE